MGLKRTDGGSLKVMILVVEVAAGEERRTNNVKQDCH